MVRDFTYGPFRELWNQHHALLVSQFLCCSSLVPFPALPLPSHQLKVLRALSWALLSLLLYPLSPGMMIHSQGLKKKKEESVFRTHPTSPCTPAFTQLSSYGQASPTEHIQSETLRSALPHPPKSVLPPGPYAQNASIPSCVWARNLRVFLISTSLIPPVAKNCCCSS